MQFYAHSELRLCIWKCSPDMPWVVLLEQGYAGPLHSQIGPALPRPALGTGQTSARRKKMLGRPPTIDSRLIRLLCPRSRTQSRCLTSTARRSANPPWSEPSSGANINDQVARLASKPLHSLALADLVRWGTLPYLRGISLTMALDTAALPFQQMPSSPPPTSASPWYQSDSLTVFTLFATSLSS